MQNELNKLTKNQLVELVAHFEHYPAVTEESDRDYILAYLEDESCTIKEDEILEYMFKMGVEITEENLPYYHRYMSDEDLIYNRKIVDSVLAKRLKMLADVLNIKNNKELQVFGEDPNSRFEKAWKFAAWLNSFESYEGQQSFFSKFGHHQNDEVRISINPGLFKYQVNGKEPKLGDLIYLPMDNSLFEITWVEPYTPFYQMGKNPIRVIVAQKFIYSGEKLAPQFQEKPEIEDPYNGLDLEPILNLDGFIDQKIDQFGENVQAQNEARPFVEPFDPIGTNPVNSFNSPFGRHEGQ